VDGSSRGAGVTSRDEFKCTAKGSGASDRVAVSGIASNGSDDSIAIQRAIDIAGGRGGGVVMLPAGTFTINSHLILRSNVMLSGVGPSTVLKAGTGFLSSQGPAGGYPMITTFGAANTTIANLSADQSGDTLNGNVGARLSGYVIEGRNSTNVVVDSVYVRKPFTYSIAMVDTTNFCVENSNVMVTTDGRYNQLDGIHILDSNSGRIINNIIRSGDDGLAAHTIGGAVHDVLYANNKVHGGAADNGLQLAAGDFPIYNIRVIGNDFYGSRFGVRTGYYDNRSGAVYNVTIVGNYIHDLTQGKYSPAIVIGGFGGLGLIKNIDITNNFVCDAGGIAVQGGVGSVVKELSPC
jgi:polygalacturonase